MPPALFVPIQLVVQAALFLAPGLMGALWLRKKYRLQPQYIVLSAILISSAIGYGAFWVYLAHPLAGKWLSTLLLVAAWLAVIFLCVSRPAKAALRHKDVWLPLALMLAVTLLYNSMFIGCRATPSAPSCYTQGLPADNQLPQFFADNTAAGHANTPFGNWLSSDRPPLQTGITLAQAPFTTIAFTGYDGYQLLASLLQCAWVPAMWLLLRKLKLTDKQLTFVMALCTVTGFFFFNSIYVWPKLIAAALGILAFCLLLFERPRLFNWTLAGAAIGAAYLAHSGVAFAFIPMAAATLVIRRTRPTWQMVAGAAAAVLILVVPWLVYQKFYDPPGDRLAKWHIAGVIQVDDRSFPQALIDSYGQAGIGGTIHNKLSNIRTLIGTYPPEGMLYGGGFLAKLRDMDFRYLLIGLAVFNAGWLAMCVPSLRKKVRDTADMYSLKVVLGTALASLAIWVLVMFGPATTIIHQGSYLTMLLLFGGLGALIARLPRRLAYTLLGVQALYFALVWIGSVLITHHPSFAALVVILTGLVACLYTLLRSNGTSVRHAYQRGKKWITKLWSQRQYIEPLLNRRPAVTIGIMLLVGALLLVWRRPETIFHAQFWAEDGRYWYASAYNNGWGDFFTPYAGYFVITYRIVALLSLLFPFHLAPVFFNVVALGIQLLPVVLLCSGRLRHIIPSRSLGVGLSLLYLAVPNSAEVFTNLTNIQWHLGVASFLVLLAAKPLRWQWRVFDFGTLLLTGFSGPLVIFLLPFALFLWWRNKTAYGRQLVYILAALALIQCIYLFFIDHTPRVGTTVASDPFNIVKMIVGQVFVGGLLGQQYVNAAYGSSLLLALLFIAGLGLMVYAFIKGPMWLRLLQLFGAMLVAGMLISLRPVAGLDLWQGLTNPGGGQRYWYIPILVWLTTLVWLAFRATIRVVKWASIALLLVLILIGIPISWRITPFPYLNFDTYATQFERSPSGTTTHIPINPGWYMDVRKK